MTVSIKDVSCLAIFTDDKDIIYTLNFSDISTSEIINWIPEDVDSFAMKDEQLLLLARKDSLRVLLLGNAGSNEIFLKSVFDAFMGSLDRLLKSRWNFERVSDKYDQVVILMNEFVYRGVVLTDNSEELSKRVMKRSFENINGMNVNKGLASFINQATKGLKK